MVVLVYLALKVFTVKLLQGPQCVEEIRCGEGRMGEKESERGSVGW
jgi:hypothetical protein